MTGHAGGNQVGRRGGQHRPEQGEVRQPRLVDRLRERHSLGRPDATASDGIEAEIRGARVGDLVQLRQVLRITGKGEQLGAGEAVGDIYRPAREAVQSFGIVGLDLYVDTAYLRPGTPVVGERAEMQAAAAIPFIEMVGAASRGDCAVETRSVQPVRWQG